MRIREAIGTSFLCAPRLLEFEIYASISRNYRQKKLNREQRDRMIVSFLVSDIDFCETRHLGVEIVHLAESVSIYDAAYVALARERGAALLTTDAKLAKTHHRGCKKILVKK
jgi:predicted nucleic acid-binding protein